MPIRFACKCREPACGHEWMSNYFYVKDQRAKEISLNCPICGSNNINTRETV